MIEEKEEVWIEKNLSGKYRVRKKIAEFFNDGYDKWRALYKSQDLVFHHSVTFGFGWTGDDSIGALFDSEEDAIEAHQKHLEDLKIIKQGAVWERVKKL